MNIVENAGQLLQKVGVQEVLLDTNHQNRRYVDMLAAEGIVILKKIYSVLNIRNTCSLE
jgi:hypothetical protein